MAKQKLLDDLDGFANQDFDQLEGGIRAENFWRSAWQNSDDLEEWRSKNKPGTED